MNTERFFQDEHLSFAEGRCSENSSRLFKPHLHRRFSIGAVSKGEIGFRIEETEFTIGPGSLALINPDTLHSCNPEPKSARSFYMLYLDPDWCCRIQRTIYRIDAFTPVLSPCLQNEELYRLYIDSMECLLDLESEIAEKEQRLTTLAEYLFTYTCRGRGEGQGPSATIEQVEALKKQLASNLDQDLPLTLTAKALGANPYTLLRLFRRHMGITPHAYRMNCRIEKARKLLQEGKDITETAFLCGFFDQSHFHRHFKSMTTVTPGEYRRSILAAKK